MTPVKKDAIPGLIINGIIAIVGGIGGYMLLRSFIENGFESDTDFSGTGEMGIVLLLVAGLVYFAAAIPLLYSIGAGISAFFKLLQLLTGLWGFAIPSVIVDCLGLVINFNLFAISLSTYEGWIVAIPIGILMALNVVTVVFDFKTFIEKDY